jgi:hypothetical protein
MTGPFITVTSIGPGNGIHHVNVANIVDIHKGIRGTVLALANGSVIEVETSPEDLLKEIEEPGDESARPGMPNEDIDTAKG